MKNCILLVLIFLLNFTIFSTSKMKIAFSKASGSKNYEKYISWLKSHNVDFDGIDLINLDRTTAIKELESCSGLVLTGGPDVHPVFYKQEYDTSRCEIDNARDTLEFALIEKALSLKLPILAICRGEQILNVAMGGSLIVDIPSDVPNSISHSSKSGSSHEVILDDSSRLYKYCGVKSNISNSFHHQAVRRIADCFKVNAKTSDGVIEGYEWKEPFGKSFLIAIQWHPERLDINSALSKPLADI